MRLPTLVVALLLSVVCRAHAQVSETPVAFDTAHRVMTVTEALVDRLHLAPPAWPVTGSFREARLYSVQSGGFVLVVPRSSGAVDRYPLSDAQRASLGAAIDAGIAATGRTTTEPGSESISEPAGNAFARRQTLLAATIYGPLAASLVDDGSAAGALYLLTTGGAFFASYGAGQSANITRAQNHLAGHMGLGAAAVGYLAGYAAGADPGDKGLRALALGAGIAGTIAGVGLAKPMSDAEAHSATAGMESVGLLALSGVGAGGGEGRALAAAAAAGIVAGGPIGLAYARRAGYTVTAGDADAVGTAGLIGGLWGGAILGEHYNRKAAFGVAGGTYLAGLLIGDRTIARGYDLSQSDANIAGVSALAGGLLGAALPVLVGENNQHAVLGFAALGATIGYAAMISTSSHAVAADVRRVGASGRSGRFQFDFQPTAALGALGRVPGRYSLLHIGF